MVDIPGRPLANTKLAKFLDKRIYELRSVKSQGQIAHEMGFDRPNILSMIKSGQSKMPLNRIVAAAKALDVDPAFIFRLALEQHFPELAKTIEEIFGNVVSANELEWVNLIREISDNTDPVPTDEMKEAVRNSLDPLFEKITA